MTYVWFLSSLLILTDRYDTAQLLSALILLQLSLRFSPQFLPSFVEFTSACEQNQSLSH